MIRLTLSIAVVCAASVFAADDDNYCTDKEAAKQWEAMTKKNPDDLELQRLHALRVGICLKIKKGGLTLEQGITIFEHDRQRLFQKRSEEERMKTEKSVQ